VVLEGGEVESDLLGENGEPDRVVGVGGGWAGEGSERELVLVVGNGRWPSVSIIS
jgi:hypothetical protein